MEIIYYTLGIFAIAGLGAFWFLYTSIKRLDMKIHLHSAQNERSLAELDDSMDKCMELISRISAKTVEYEVELQGIGTKVNDLDDLMNTAREAMAEWSEAAKVARKSEEDFNDGLNNILNFQPGVTKKGDDN